MKRKFLLIILIALGVGIKGVAMISPVDFETRFNASSLIVEGKVIQQYSFWNPAHSMIFTSNTLELSKVFKGTAPGTTIEIMTIGGIVGLDGVQASDLLNLHTGQQGVFFLNPNVIGLLAPKSGALLFDVYASMQGFIAFDPFNHSAADPFTSYPGILYDLYPKLQGAAGHAFQSIGNSGGVELPVANKSTGSITSFSPARVWGGAHFNAANNTLTIVGTGFGTNSGSAAVLFKNADDGGATTVSVNAGSTLIVSWTTTQIVVKVPQTAGTGVIQVVDNTGTLAGTSSTSLVVDFAVMTVDFGAGVSNGPEEVNLMNTNALGGYTVTYSTSTAGSGVDITSVAGQPYKDAFVRALTTHKEGTGFNVTINASTTSTQAVTNDAINVVQLDNTNTGVGVLPNGVLAVCYSYFTKCASTSLAAQKKGFDITIRNAGVSTGSVSFSTGPCPPMSTSSSNIDLETVIFHELGHACDLNHVIQTYTGTGLPQINPGAVMNFALVNGVKRSSPDYALLTGGVYAVAQSSNSYGSCGAAPGEMIPLTTIIPSTDECAAVTLGQTAIIGYPISFDLNHATSNRYTDPQATAVNTGGTTTAITNTQYYGFKTQGITNGRLAINISNYGTIPSTVQGSCSGVGVELSLYQVSSCPAGGSFPAPVAYQTFNASGPLTTITGLAANTSYLLMLDGVENTKASFVMALSSSALPLQILRFDGYENGTTNTLNWIVNKDEQVKTLSLERSSDGIHFYQIYSFLPGSETTITGSFDDQNYSSGSSLYRLAAKSSSGELSYSNTVALDRQLHTHAWISPNPGSGQVNLQVNVETATTLEMNILDIRGVILVSKSFQSLPGTNVWSLPTELLVPGVYTILLNDPVTGHKDVLKLSRQ